MFRFLPLVAAFAMISCSSCRTAAPKEDAAPAAAASAAPQSVAEPSGASGPRIGVDLPGDQWLVSRPDQVPPGFQFFIVNKRTQAAIGFSMLERPGPREAVEALSARLRSDGFACGAVTVSADGDRAGFTLTITPDGQDKPAAEGKVSARALPGGGSIVAQGVWMPASAPDMLKDFDYIVDQLKIE
ncbi:hypothetical protein A3C96_02760 [Candidatus Uhrbacteria bacterium RIFCSPHIGHO2_02_FULL_60_10]|uniref:Uncharacterized protein n=1 Tax=Candidatus Uhrbacteria bacterium RIFCSPHIGHO2_02_FULL_60_10 TaxID=1802392 RepID=A0A1F7U857_9BACT|nr:MAG: hypothetical protein A3C96_02760 [Candidatus Uhrbacteria bacterium RIFCSPHIGHO2_02_FULL_60_10]